MDIRFSNLSPDGNESNVRVISRADILRCPSVILLASHYRADGSCRHDELTCENDGCSLPKVNGEIFCQKHLDEMGG